MIEQERNTFRKLLIEHKAITDFDDENPHVTIYLDDLTDLVDEIRERNGKMWSELFMKANAMYSAAQYLSTDASQLHKAMEDYHQFIINTYNELKGYNDVHWLR